MAKTGAGEANYIHLRLFMEGIEVPVIGASVNATVNQPSSASIQIVPSDKLSTLLPRTVVHLFYLDAVEFAGSQLGAPEDQHYKLMFCGEVFDISFAKSGHGSRTVTLRCMDFSNTWDTNYSYVMRYAVGAQEDPSGNAITKNVSGFVGGGASDGLSSPNPFDDIVNDPATVIRQMALASAGNPACPGNGTILGGLLAVLELLSGIQGLYMGINPWATIEERRCRVMDSIVSDNGQTAKSLFDQQVFSDWLQQRVGTVGSVISFRQIIQIICQYIYYDVVTNVTPMYEPGNDGRGRPGRLAPEYVVTGTASSEAQAASVENVSDVISEMGEYETFSGVTVGKIGNIAAEFWPYVETMLKKMDEIAQTKQYLYGEAAGDGITFAMTSGHRNVESNLRLMKASGRTPDPEAAAKGAHAKGYAVDITGRGNHGGGNLGSMPYRNEPKENCTGAGFSKLTVSIPQENISDSSISRFRYALKQIYDRDNVVITDFEALVLKVKADVSLMELCFGTEEILDKHANYLRNMKTFFTEVYKPAVSYANANTEGITGSWGGDWKHRCPLFHCLGMGPDPVHIQDSNYRNKPSTTQAAPPPSVVAKLSEGEIREQLKSFIFRPNIWFCPPPVCNVLYPHMYESMSVSRQMLRETTRLQLDAFNQFYESVILSTYYYAPKFPEGNHVFGSGMGSVTKTILMDHEVFSGIVPKMERISEISFYAKSSGSGSDLRLDATEGELESSDVSEANASSSGASIAEYGDRVAHFNLLTHRYSARTGSASGPFNPYLVCGFPALLVNELVDKGLESRQGSVRTIMSGNRDPDIAKKTQWLGMITSLDHTFNQSGARTSVGLSYVRSHRVGDDTDDLLSESVTDQGSFTVQDPNFQPEGVPRVVSHSFSSGTVATSYTDHIVAEGLSDRTSDYAWIVSAITATMGGFDLFGEVLATCEQRFSPLDPVSQARVTETYGEPSAYESSTAGSSDFSRNGNAVGSILAMPKGPGNAVIESIEWSGEPTVILISVTATEPCNFANLVKWPEIGGKLGTVTYDSFLTKSYKLGETASAVQSDPKLVMFLDLTWSPLATEPQYISAVVPVKLPGSTLTATLSPPATGAQYDRSLPVEEAIRPPWIDKDTYSSALSTRDTFTKLDLHYRHLFGSPSIIHRLLVNGTTPYDGMDVHSVEQAVDFIVADAGSIIDEPETVLNSYTSALTTRPIASLPDVLAPKGYVPSKDTLGRIHWTFDPSLRSKADLQVSGGFHSNAVTGLRFSKDGKNSNADGVSPSDLEFGAALEFLDLVGLTGPDGTPRVLGSRLTEGEAEEINSATAVRADPRAPRAKRVKRYLDDINGSSALRQVPDGVTFIKTPPGVGRKG